jgi:hypothetical protein
MCCARRQVISIMTVFCVHLLKEQAVWSVSAGGMDRIGHLVRKYNDGLSCTPHCFFLGEIIGLE